MIVSTGIIQLENEWYSAYLLGWVNNKWIAENRSDLWPSYTLDENEGLLHYKLVRRYMRERQPLLYVWLDESRTSYGGLIGEANGSILGWLQALNTVTLLLTPDSIQETAFRLCFDIKAKKK